MSTLVARLISFFCSWMGWTSNDEHDVQSIVARKDYTPSPLCQRLTRAMIRRMPPESAESPWRRLALTPKARRKVTFAEENDVSEYVNGDDECLDQESRRQIQRFVTKFEFQTTEEYIKLKMQLQGSPRIVIEKLKVTYG